MQYIPLLSLIFSLALRALEFVALICIIICCIKYLKEHKR